ncbi:MAG: ABC transporter substrate-binding protein [Pseudomonadota bacterium]
MILSPLGHADEACEMFLGRALNQMFSTIESNPEQEDSELRALVQANVDTLSIARFTLGKYATQVSPNDLLTYSRSLNGYFLETIHDNIRDGKHLSADILKSFDRNHRDCIVETVIHRESLEDLTVVWRVMRVGEQHQILDIAPVQNGNTIWLAIELRAQVVDLYERSDGDLDLVIRKLGIG